MMARLLLAPSCFLGDPKETDQRHASGGKATMSTTHSLPGTCNQDSIH